MLDFANVVKAQITQSLLSTLCERAGYRVTRFGVEELVGEVKFLDRERYEALQLPEALRFLPDLLVAEPQLTAAFMVEVKFRRRLSDGGLWSLREELVRQREYWPNSYAVLMLAEPRHPDCCFHQDYIRVVRPDQLDVLTRPGRWMYDRWDDLPHLQHVFTRMKGSLELQGNADLITTTLRQLGELREDSPFGAI